MAQPTKVEIVGTGSSVKVGETLQLEFAWTPDGAIDTFESWEISEKGSVTVSISGVVTGVETGDTYIMGRTAGGLYTQWYAITVEESDTAIAVTEVLVSPSSKNINAGDKFTATASILPTNATDKRIRWSSSNTTVATVSQSGIVTTLAEGVCVIRATSTNNKIGRCSLIVDPAVNVDVTSVTVSPTSKSAFVGNTFTVTATVSPTDATNKSITWSSSNTSIATVSQSGVVTCNNSGSATITATSNNGKTSTCSLSVSAKVIDVTSVEFTRSTSTMTTGDTYQFTARVLPTDADNQLLTWRSTNSRATVNSSGLVSAVSAGQVTIVATSNNGKEARQIVNIAEQIINPSSITISAPRYTIKDNETLQFSAVVEPSNATDSSVVWSVVGNATMSNAGLLTPSGTGQLIVTGRTANGLTSSKSIEVLPSFIAVTSITLSPLSQQLKVGESANYNVTVTPADATDKTVTLTSSNDTIVNVDGMSINALSVGKVVITATAHNGVSTLSNVTVERSVDVVGKGEHTIPLQPINTKWLKTNRIYWQYRNKPKLTAWYNITRDIGQSLYDASQVVRNMYNVDMMSGAQLDIIGRVVVADRNYIKSQLLKTASYAPDGQGAQYGDEEAMYSVGATDVNGTMSDELYRLVIKSKIIKNNCGAYIEDILKAFKTLFPNVTQATLRDYEDMSFDIQYSGEITELERWALLNVNLLPKPVGVRIIGFEGVVPGLVQVGDMNYQVGDTKSELKEVTRRGI